MKRLLSLLFLVSFNFAYSNTDSLSIFINQTEDANLRFEAINQFVSLNVGANPKEAQRYAEFQIQESKIDTQVARAYLNLGLTLDYQSEFDSAIKYYNKSLILFKEVDNEFWQAQALLNLGIVNYFKGNDDAAVSSYHSALKKFEILGDKGRMSAIYNNLGNLYKSRGGFQKALVYHRKSLEIDIGRKDTLGIAGSYNNLGIDFRNIGKPDSALFFYEKSLVLKKAINDESGIANTLTNIGQVYFHLKEYDKSLKYNLEALAIERKVDNKRGISQSYINIGEGYLNAGDINSASYYLENGYEMAMEIGVVEDVMSALEGLSKASLQKEDYEKALEYYKSYTVYKDSLLNEETNNQIAKLDAIYENDAKRKEISLLNQEKKLQETALKNEELQKVIMGVALLLVLAILVFLFRDSQQRKKSAKLLAIQKSIVEQKNREITDSINYAQRIQNAVLNSEDRIQSKKIEHFILFQPKDIVSGDFYWMLDKDDYTYITVADCTGHGVPGAFMSMLGIAFLNEINATDKVLSPAEILEELSRKIIKELGQKGGVGESRDGMDISMVKVDKKNNVLEWSGANNPLWMVTSIKDTISKANTVIEVDNSSSRFCEIKADKQPVGFFKGHKKFTNHSLTYAKGDIAYLFSDGYADQFGGKKGKKMMKKQFKQLLITSANKTIEEQGNMLSQHFFNWKGNADQVDDVCVIGVKL